MASKKNDHSVDNCDEKFEEDDVSLLESKNLEKETEIESFFEKLVRF